MKTFEYANPSSVKDAVALLSSTWGETEVLAGGTDLLTSIKQDVTAPRLVVSLKDVKGLSGISVKGGNLNIGATTSLKDLIAARASSRSFVSTSGRKCSDLLRISFSVRNSFATSGSRTRHDDSASIAISQLSNESFL